MNLAQSPQLRQRRDDRDLAIEDLALSEAQLITRIVDLEADVAAYRLLAQEAVHAVARLTHQLDRQREQHGYVLHAYQRLREQILQAEAA